MPDSVVYVPFTSDAKLLQQGARLARIYNQNGCLTTNSSLKNVNCNLIILAHGALHSDKLYAATQPPCEYISAKELAKNLKEQGLTTNCPHIELFACDAGADSSTAGRGFASRLKAELHRRHLDIEVEGYSTPVGTTRAGQQVVLANVTGTGRNARIVR